MTIRVIWWHYLPIILKRLPKPATLGNRLRWNNFHQVFGPKFNPIHIIGITGQVTDYLERFTIIYSSEFVWFGAIHHINSPFFQGFKCNRFRSQQELLCIINDNKQVTRNNLGHIAGYKIKNVAGIIKSIAIGTRCNNGRSPRCLQNHSWQKEETRSDLKIFLRLCLVKRKSRWKKWKKYKIRFKVNKLFL